MSLNAQELKKELKNLEKKIKQLETVEAEKQKLIQEIKKIELKELKLREEYQEIFNKLSMKKEGDNIPPLNQSQNLEQYNNNN